MFRIKLHPFRLLSIEFKTLLRSALHCFVRPPGLSFSVCPARYKQLLWRLLTPLCLSAKKVSPGKSSLLTLFFIFICVRELAFCSVPSTYARYIYRYKIVGYGLCNDVLTYPLISASYVLPVRRYRSLQYRFLHSCRRRQRACDLLTGFTNLPVRDLHPLEKNNSPILRFY